MTTTPTSKANSYLHFALLALLSLSIIRGVFNYQPALVAVPPLSLITAGLYGAAFVFAVCSGNVLLMSKSPVPRINLCVGVALFSSLPRPWLWLETACLGVIALLYSESVQQFVREKYNAARKLRQLASSAAQRSRATPAGLRQS